MKDILINIFNMIKFVQTKKVRHIIKPKCINFDETAVKIHGITQERANKKGIDAKEAMVELQEDLRKVDFIISHNITFHIRTLQVECFRTYTYIDFSKFKLIDTLNFYHKLGPKKLRNLAQEVLNKDYSKKKTKFNLTIIKKVFLELYNQYEASVKN